MGNVPTKVQSDKSNTTSSSKKDSQRNVSSRRSVLSVPSLASAGHDTPKSKLCRPGAGRTASETSQSGKHHNGHLMLEETVDGGYFHDHGVYSGTPDYNEKVVRHLMIDRKLAPFFKGLADFDETWTDRQLLAAVRGLPIPEPDSDFILRPESKLSAISRLSVSAENAGDDTHSTADKSVNDQNSSDKHNYLNNVLESDILSTSLPVDSSLVEFPQLNSSSVSTSGADPADASPSSHESHHTASTSSNSDVESGHSTVSTAATYSEDDELALKEAIAHVEHVHTKQERDNRPIRNRSKTASQVVASASAPQKPIDVLLYRKSIECPICFLYYPKYMNYTRCCAQPICTECFLQIKRPEPHFPHHDDGPSSFSGTDSSSQRSISSSGDHILVSEPTQCPYCNSLDFGIVYINPPFKSGVCSAGASSSSATLRRHTRALLLRKKTDDINTTVIKTELAADIPTPNEPGEEARRRGSIPPTAPEVVMSDLVRPDWALKLTTARHRMARKSAAASALHASAFSPSSLSANYLSTVSDRSRVKTRFRAFSVGSSASFSPSSVAAARETRSSRQIAREVEEMMLEEAVRLSLYDQPSRSVTPAAASTSLQN